MSSACANSHGLLTMTNFLFQNCSNWKFIAVVVVGAGLTFNDQNCFSFLSCLRLGEVVCC